MLKECSRLQNLHIANCNRCVMIRRTDRMPWNVVDDELHAYSVARFELPAHTSLSEHVQLEARP